MFMYISMAFLTYNQKNKFFLALKSRTQFWKYLKLVASNPLWHFPCEKTYDTHGKWRLTKHTFTRLSLDFVTQSLIKAIKNMKI